MERESFAESKKRKRKEEKVAKLEKQFIILTSRRKENILCEPHVHTLAFFALFAGFLTCIPCV